MPSIPPKKWSDLSSPAAVATGLGFLGVVAMVLFGWATFVPKQTQVCLDAKREVENQCAAEKRDLEVKIARLEERYDLTQRQLQTVTERLALYEGRLQKYEEAADACRDALVSCRSN